MTPTLDTLAALEGELGALREQGAYQAALHRIDAILEALFGSHGQSGPESPAELAQLSLLAMHKGRLLREATTLVIHHPEQGSQSLVPSEQHADFHAQALNWTQIGMAANQRGLGALGHDAPAAWRRFYLRQLDLARQVFLAFDEPATRELLSQSRQLVRHLFSQLWLADAFGGAEDLLYLLSGIEGREEILVTAQNFYRELAALPDARLEAGGLSRAELAEARAEWDH